VSNYPINLGKRLRGNGFVEKKPKENRLKKAFLYLILNKRLFI
jgi:hypothetical protein